MSLPITLSAGDAMPLHRQLTKELKNLILCGQLASGRRLPSTRALANTLRISRATASLAYEQLLREGFVEAYSGSGTFVAREIPGRAPHEQSMQHYTLSESRTDRQLEMLESFSPGAQNEVVDFRPSAGSNDRIPLQQWRKLLAQRMNQLTIPDYCHDVRGYVQLRETLARHLQRTRGVKCSPDQIFVLGSTQQALTLVARVHVQRDTVVAVENPGFVTARRIFEGRGATLLPIPVDEHGLVTERLADAARAGAKLVYVTPSHQVPSGSSMALLRRLELVKWAQKESAVIIEDDYGSEYKYSGNAVPAMQSYNSTDSLVYMGTFAKLMFPSLRITYLVVPRSFIRAYCAAKRLLDDRSPMVEQCALADFIADGCYDRLLRRNKAIYAARRQTLVQAIEERLGSVVSIFGGDTGTHMMVRFKTHLSDNEIIQQAAQAGVLLASTKEHYMDDSHPQREFLLSFAHVSEEQIVKGVACLAQVLHGTVFSGTSAFTPNQMAV